MDKVKLVKQTEKYALIIGFVTIFIGVLHPVFNYISTGAFAITYVTALIRQYQTKGKIEFISFLLCTSSMLWVILRQFVHSPYVLLGGQVILYAYLFNTQRIFLGKIKKSFLAYAVCALGLGFIKIQYTNVVTNVLNIAMQLWIIFKFLDPILESIALKHREKRLANEAAQREKEEIDKKSVIVDAKIVSVEKKEETEEENIWKAESIQV